MRTRPSAPVVKHPVVDRLVFLLPCTLDHFCDSQMSLDSIRVRIKKEMDDGTCEHAFVEHRRYRVAFRIPLSGKTKALVQVGARDPNRQKGDVLVSMNPAKFEPGDVEHFHEVMGRIFTLEYRDLLRRALLHRVDFAVDIVHADLSRMLVRYSNAQRSTTFGKRVDGSGLVETYNFGSETSNYMTSVYSKNIEQVHQAALALARKGRQAEPLTDNAIKQLERVKDTPPTVRVEVRGVKLLNMSLGALQSQTNRFARFSFAYLSESDGAVEKWLEDAFLSLSRDRGVKAALAAFKGSGYARQVNAFWASRRWAWWQPEPLWEQACNALRESGVFPVDAFAPENPDNSQLGDLPLAPSSYASTDLPHQRPPAIVFTRVRAIKTPDQQGVSRPPQGRPQQRF